MIETPESRRIERERRTLSAMIRIHCRARHGTRLDVCPDCAGLLAYAEERLERCPFGYRKPVCAKCTVHCYKPEARERIREVMRYAGPRMILRHPVLAALHMLDSARAT
jgi:hypothetical protein